MRDEGYSHMRCYTGVRECCHSNGHVNWESSSRCSTRFGLPFLELKAPVPIWPEHLEKTLEEFTARIRELRNHYKDLFESHQSHDTTEASHNIQLALPTLRSFVQPAASNAPTEAESEALLVGIQMAAEGPVSNPAPKKPPSAKRTAPERRYASDGAHTHHVVWLNIVSNLHNAGLLAVFADSEAKMGMRVLQVNPNEGARSELHAVLTPLANVAWTKSAAGGEGKRDLDCMFSHYKESLRMGCSLSRRPGSQASQTTLFEHASTACSTRSPASYVTKGHDDDRLAACSSRDILRGECPGDQRIL